MFLTDPDFYALTSCVMFRKNSLFLARLQGILVNLNDNYRRYNFQAFADISRNIKFPENLQPCLLLLMIPIV